MMGPFFTEKKLHVLGKRNEFDWKIYIWYVHFIIQEDLQKVLNKKNVISLGGNK